MATRTGKRQQPKYGLFEFLIGGLFSVGLPALMTAIAPVSWLEFNRVEERVTAKAQTCLLFVIPYRTPELADVKEVTTTFKLGEGVTTIIRVETNRKGASSCTAPNRGKPT